MFLINIFVGLSRTWKYSNEYPYTMHFQFFIGRIQCRSWYYIFAAGAWISGRLHIYVYTFLFLEFWKLLYSKYSELYGIYIYIKLILVLSFLAAVSINAIKDFSSKLPALTGRSDLKLLFRFTFMTFSLYEILSSCVSRQPRWCQYRQAYKLTAV